MKKYLPGMYVIIVHTALQIAFLCSHQLLGQTGAWKERKSLGVRAPIPGASGASFTLNNKAYVQTAHQFWLYDPLLNSWSQKADYSGDFNAGTLGFGIHGKGYLYSVYNNEFVEYNPISNQWLRKATFPGHSRFQGVAFSVGSKGYLGTGVSLVNGFPLKDFWQYDPASDSWSQKKDFGGVARSRAVGFAIGNKGFIGTGLGGDFFDALKDFWEYEPSTDQWTEKASFGGGGRHVAVGFPIGDRGYIGTGMDTTTDQSSDFWEYNPSLNQWTRKADFKGSGRFLATAFSIGNKGYLGSGAAWTAQVRKDLWEYNPASDSWTEKASFNRMDRAGAIAFTIGNKGYVGTGGDADGPKKDFWQYDVANDLWTQKADFEGLARTEAVAFSIGAKGYVGTGSRQEGYLTAPSSDFWEYDPALNKWSRKADFPGAGRFNAVGFSIGSKGYLGTGNDGKEFKKDFWEYEPLLDTWTSRSFFPGVVGRGHVGFNIGTFGYVGLGMGKYFWQYSPATNSWLRKADYPGRDSIEAVGFSIGDKGYVGLATSDYFYGGSKEMWEYNPASDKWMRKTDFPGSERSQAVAFAVGAKAYIGTGTFFYSASNSDFWEFDPSNNSPVSNAWIAKYYSRTSLLLNGWGSYDPDGSSIRYQWKKVAGPFRHRMLYADAATPVISDLIAGIYTFRLTIADNLGATASTDVSFTINENRYPVADGWLMKYNSPTSVLLNAWGSYDPDGFPVTFRWDKIAGPSQYTMQFPDASTPVIANLVQGTYKFQLTVTDNEGAKALDTVTVTVNNLTSIAANDRPAVVDEIPPLGMPTVSSLFIYPTITKDVIHVKWNSGYKGDVRVTVMDMSGRIVFHRDSKKDNAVLQNVIPVSHLKTGKFILTVKAGDGKVFTSSFVKQ